MTDRISGRRLQERRLRIWSRSPYCAHCGKLVELSARKGYGFELDHIEPLKADGGKGEDTDDNTQVLCNGDAGCHRKKTARDMGHRPRVRVGLDGFPIEGRGASKVEK